MSVAARPPGMTAKGTESYVDDQGRVRYRREPGRRYKYVSSLNPITITEDKIKIDAVSQDEWEQVMDRLGMGHMARSSEWKERVAGMSYDNVNRDKRQGAKKRHSWKQPKNIDMVMRRAKALELRRAGYTYDEISKVSNLGYRSVGAVQNDLQQLYKAMLDEPAKDVLALELSRLEAVVRFLWQEVRNGDLNSMDRLFHAMKIKHNLLGLNSPVKHEVTTTDHFDAEIDRLTRELGELDATPETKIEYTEDSNPKSMDKDTSAVTVGGAKVSNISNKLEAKEQAARARKNVAGPTSTGRST